MKKLLMTFLLILGSIYLSLGQDRKNDPHDWIRLGFRGSANVGMSLFRNEGLMPPTVSLTPFISPSATLFINKELNKKTRIELGLGIMQIGFRKVLTTHYNANKRFENQNVDKSSFSLLKIPIFGQYYLNKDDNSSLPSFIQAGLIIINNPVEASFGSRSSALIDPFNGDRVSEIITRDTPKFTKVLASIGLGVDKTLKNGGAVTARINYNLSFSELGLWEYQIDIGSDSFRNTITEKKSNIEISIGLLLPPLGYRKRIGELNNIKGNI
ncbi:hypothetical protein QQ020_11975 [Fulvivirgaceae bacterium BMA12]|uniref:Outer membrane protein beta-barrel domain-containing protein n=1 Tax=Agaribacillus aureus TaxID=3051825 RepID=A0ABT8L4T1_9BACT|nr:hypothetical protein [Fulvivirgaceae bacterium BMA12]